MRRGLLVPGLAALAVATVGLTTGCSTLGYYAQSVEGHLRLLGGARPVDEWLGDPLTQARLREQLALSQRLRDYAVAELKLPDNASYRRYSDLQRTAAVWNVAAAPEFSLTLQNWCFPVLGCVSYRGYYDRASADGFAAGLRSQGLEVTVYPVPAYSTLGALPGAWLSDPLLNTFIDYPEGELARLMFHELAHQVAYASGDTTFNESFATAVERIGGERWLATKAGPAARETYARLESRRQDFRALTSSYKARLERLYNQGTADRTDPTLLRVRKQALLDEMRAEYAALKSTRWGGFAGYDGWFARANNAALGMLSAYDDLVPAFERLYLREGRDFERFYAEVRRLSRLPRDERRAALNNTGD